MTHTRPSSVWHLSEFSSGTILEDLRKMVSEMSSSILHVVGQPSFLRFFGSRKKGRGCFIFSCQYWHQAFVYMMTKQSYSERSLSQTRWDILTSGDGRQTRHFRKKNKKNKKTGKKRICWQQGKGETQERIVEEKGKNRAWVNIKPFPVCWT